MGISKGDIRVLLVDNAQIAREGLSTLLTIVLGYSQIKEAADGYEALKLARDYKPHLVLMDTNMPGLDGDEVCEQMRQQDYGKNAAILGMSINDYPQLKERWLQAHADGFFPKGVKVNELGKIIEAALKKYQQQ